MMEIKKTESFIEHDIIVDGAKVGEVELCPERTEIARLVIFEPYQNNGYGTEVVKSLIEQGYNCLWVRSDNPRAIHVYEKCGFKREQTHMFEMRLRNISNQDDGYVQIDYEALAKHVDELLPRKESEVLDADNN